MKTSLDAIAPWPLESSDSSHERSQELSEIAFAPELLQSLLKRLQAPLGGLADANEGRPSPPEANSATQHSSAAEESPATTSSAGRGGVGAPLQSTGDVPDQLNTEVFAPGLGNVQVQVRRGSSGLSIVMSVADQSVKRMIEQAQGALRETLENGGLRVASVEIRQHGAAGTTFAQDRVKARAWSARNKKDAYHTREGDPGEAGEQINLKV